MEQQQETTVQDTGTTAAIDTSNDNTDSGGQGLSWTDEQKAYIESLRKENAKYRTKAKELETQYTGLNERFSKVEKGLKGLFGESEEEASPEEQLSALQAHNENLVLNSALTEAAMEYGIGKEDFIYFKFLVQERLSALEDGEELTEEDLDVLAKEARRGKAASATSVEGGGPAPEVEGGITLAEFQAMGINERSALFGKNEALYKQLIAQERAAKAKK
jgi:hypothetical protein